MHMPRSEVHRSLLQSLRSELVDKTIPTLGREDQERLLERSFPFIQYPELESVPIALLKRLPEIPQVYLETLVRTPELRTILDKLPVVVQRQVWALSPEHFESKLEPLLEAYRQQATQRFQNVDSAGFTVAKIPTDRWRAHTACLKDLLDNIGSNRHLFDHMYVLLAKRFSTGAADDHGGEWRKHSAIWCVLLNDLLLESKTRQDANRSQSWSRLVKHQRLASTLDLAVREGKLSPESLVTIQNCM